MTSIVSSTGPFQTVVTLNVWRYAGTPSDETMYLERTLPEKTAVLSTRSSDGEPTGAHEQA